jgi:hypothetical protein
MWSGGKIPCILYLGTRLMWVVGFMLWPFYPPEKTPRHPLDWRLGAAQSRSERGSEEKNFLLASTGNRIAVAQTVVREFPALCGIRSFITFYSRYSLILYIGITFRAHSSQKYLSIQSHQKLFHLLFRTTSKCYTRWLVIDCQII